MTPTPLNIFKEMLESHDWFFDYSDDGKVWVKGLASLKAIRDTAGQSPHHRILYESYLKEHSKLSYDYPYNF